MKKHILCLIICASIISAYPKDEPLSPSDQARNIADHTKHFFKNQSNKVTQYFKDLGTLFAEEYRAVRGRDLTTGQDVKSDEGWLSYSKRRLGESGVATVAATLSTVGASYLLEQLFKTDSRYRNKGIIFALTTLSSYYGTCIKRRANLANYQLTSGKVFNRLMLIAVMSCLATFTISIFSHWGSFNDKDEKRKKKRKMSLRKHFLWALEVGGMQLLAATLGYTFDGIANKKRPEMPASQPESDHLHSADQQPTVAG